MNVAVPVTIPPSTPGTPGFNAPGYVPVQGLSQVVAPPIIQWPDGRTLQGYSSAVGTRLRIVSIRMAV